MADYVLKTNQDIIKGCVCEECGGRLKLITLKGERETTFCPICNKTHTMTLPEIYQLAKEYCDTHYFVSQCYWTENPELNKRLAIGQMCRIIRWLRPRLTILEESGETEDIIADYQVEAKDDMF